MFPLTPGILAAVCAGLKLAGYRSVKNYLYRAKGRASAILVEAPDDGAVHVFECYLLSPISYPLSSYPLAPIPYLLPPYLLFPYPPIPYPTLT